MRFADGVASQLATDRDDAIGNMQRAYAERDQLLSDLRAAQCETSAAIARAEAAERQVAVERMNVDTLVESCERLREKAGLT
jgi:hypothetical protein